MIALVISIMFAIMLACELYYFRRLANYLYDKTSSLRVKTSVIFGSYIAGAAFTLLLLSFYLLNLYNPVTKILFFLSSLMVLPTVLLTPLMLDERILRLIVRLFRKYILHNSSIALPWYRTSNMRNILWALTAIPFIYYAYGYLSSTENFKVNRIDIYSSRLPDKLDGVTIAQVSDVHFGAFWYESAVKEAFNLLNSLNADVIVFTGDYVNNSEKEFLPEYQPYISNLHTRNGRIVLGCLGNHDYYAGDGVAKLIEKIEASGINLLQNESVRINMNDTSFVIAGVDNPGGFSMKKDVHSDIEKALANAGESDFTVLLAHNPNYWKDTIVNLDKSVDLTLTGHTHAGQIGINLFGSEYSFAQFQYKYWAGFYEKPGRYLYVNRGLGMVGLPFRIFMPPEITLITLRHKQ